MKKHDEVYRLVDSRSMDRYEDFQIFKRLEDAEAMKTSMGSDSHFFDIHKVNVFK